MRKADLYSSAVLFVFGLVLLFFIIPTQTVTVEDYVLPPSAFPTICAVIIICLSAVVFVSAILNGNDRREFSVTRDDVLAFICVVGSMTVAIAIFKFLHALPAGLFLLLGIMLSMGERRLTVLIATPVVMIGGTYVLFYHVLGTAIE